VSSPDHDVAIIGGGFYGCVLAEHLRRERGLRVLLIERDADILQRASLVNQARVHGGYHYPRSILTGVRSRANFQRFVDDFADAIFDRFDKYYAIARRGSNVTAAQFELFCHRIGAPIRPAPDRVREWFDPQLIENVFEVQEYAFDATLLATQLRDQLARAGVELALQSEVERVEPGEGNTLAVTCLRANERRSVSVRQVFNCTYSRINKVLTESGRPPLPLKHELTEMALVDVPDELKGVGITVMCGPFFSLMPFPSRGFHSLSHVRYTPHCEWHDDPDSVYQDPQTLFDTLSRRSRAASMQKDAERYVPLVGGCRYVDSLWEVKTVLPRSEVDDSRPILMVRDESMPNLVSIMGSKVDNVYDMLDMAAPAGDGPPVAMVPEAECVIE
jgi:glycine/D-amino acid oxidase-like deaminating enzyme